MRRRKFLKYSVIAVSGSLAGVAGYEVYNIYRHPEYKFLTKHKELISAIAETIIPVTDSPGAGEAGVGEFIIDFMTNSVSETEANTVISGLKDVEVYCTSNFNKTFELCSTDEKIMTLEHLEDEILFPKSSLPGKIKNKLIGRSFVEIFKELTVIGYCTSEAGATRGLVYVPVPVYYQSCTELKPGQRSWATK